MYCTDINDLYGYLICPLKFSFSNTESKKLTCYNNIKSVVYGQLFDYSLYLRMTGQPISIKELNSKLNYIWNGIKDDIEYLPTIKERLSIKNKLAYFPNMLKNITKVEEYNVPQLVKILDTDILYFRYKVIQDDYSTVYIKINNPHFNMNENNTQVQMILNFIQEQNKNDKVMMFRTDTGHVYSCKKKGDPKIEQIISAMQKNIHYPRGDFISCQSCAYEKKCPWSSRI